MFECCVRENESFGEEEEDESDFEWVCEKMSECGRSCVGVDGAQQVKGDEE